MNPCYIAEEGDDDWVVFVPDERYTTAALRAEHHRLSVAINPDPGTLIDMVAAIAEADFALFGVGFGVLGPPVTAAPPFCRCGARP